MNGYEVVSPLALYDAMNDINQRRDKQMQAQQMMQTNGWAGGAGILGAALGGLLSGQYGREANDMENNYAKQAFLYEQEQARMAQEAKAEARRMEREQKLADEQAKYDREQAGKWELTKYKTDNAKGIQVTNNMPSTGQVQSKFQETLATKNADKFNKWESEAWAANETMSSLAQLKQISELQKTGKMAEAGAIIGQAFGTDAASNMQAFNSVASSLVLQQAEKLSGAMSDGDIRLLESTMPNFGNDPRANEIIYGVLERAAQRAIGRYENAEKYVQSNGKLQGFKPEFQFSRSQGEKAQPKPQATKSLGGKSYVQIDGQWYEQ